MQAYVMHIKKILFDIFCSAKRAFKCPVLPSAKHSRQWPAMQLCAFHSSAQLHKLELPSWTNDVRYALVRCTCSFGVVTSLCVRGLGTTSNQRAYRRNTRYINQVPGTKTHILPVRMIKSSNGSVCCAPVQATAEMFIQHCNLYTDAQKTSGY